MASAGVNKGYVSYDPYDLPDKDTVPVIYMYAVHDELREAIHSGNWRRAYNRAVNLLHFIKVIRNQGNEHRWGKPHFDGLFTIGKMFYEKAPERYRRAIDRYNKELDYAKDDLAGRLEKKRKK